MLHVGTHPVSGFHPKNGLTGSSCVFIEFRLFSLFFFDDFHFLCSCLSRACSFHPRWRWTVKGSFGRRQENEV